MNDKILKYQNLIYKVMNKLHCDLDEEAQDQLYFSGLMGLYNGIKTFDETRNVKELTYYYSCVKNSILTQYYHNSRKKRDKIRTYSIEELLYGEVRLQDTIASDIDIEAETIEREQWDLIIDTLNKTKNTLWKQYICEFYGIGQKQLNIKEMALKYGITPHAIQSSILQGIKRLRKKVLKEYERKNK